jgi:DNA-binding SARP family transcriptional activator
MAVRIAEALKVNSRTSLPTTAARLDDLKAYLARILQETVEAEPLPLMLIIDNAHLISEAEDSLDLLEWLLLALPEGAEVVISGRAPVSIAEIDRRLAGGQCLLLGREDLTFNHDEVAELCAEAGVEASGVVEVAAGWPIGVAAILAGAVPGAGRKLEAGAAWDRYLINEIWVSIPAELRTSIMALAIPATLDPGLTELLLGAERSQFVSDWLLQHDALLLAPAIDGELRLNPLLRQFLLNEFRKTDAREFERLARICIAALEETEGCVMAVHLALEIELRAPLAELLERLGSEFILRGAFPTFITAYESLKGRFAPRSWLLKALYARALAHSLRPADAIARADEVLAAKAASGAAKVHAHLARQRALRLFGRLEELMLGVVEMRESIDTDDHWALAEAAYAEAEIQGLAVGNLTRAEERLVESISHARRAKATMLELFGRSSLGQCLAMKGEAPAAIEELTRAARGWRAVPNTSHLGVVLNNLGMSYGMIGDHESAMGILKEAYAEGQACQNARNEAFAVASLAEACVATRRFEEAQKYYEESIRLCAETVTDESLAAQSIAGLAGAHLGMNDLQQADYFAERAWWIAEKRCGPLEQAICQVAQAKVAAANGKHSEAIALFERAIEGYAESEALGSIITARYGLAAAHFRSRNRAQAQEVLDAMFASLSEPWMVGGLLPAAREDPMFAEWVASRPDAPPAFKAVIASRQHAPLDDSKESSNPVSLFPPVRAISMGSLSVSVDGRTVPEEVWESARAKELFYLLLANREGVRKEQVLERLFPEISADKCNSNFHSNVYRVRHALYQESVIRQSGAYQLNPAGVFEWDLEEFYSVFEKAKESAAGSDERAALFREAIARYTGPFAEAFYSEWAEVVRARAGSKLLEALAMVAGFHAARGEFEEAAECVARIFDEDRFNDQAAFDLALFRARSGNAAAALNHLDNYRQWYADELGDALPERFQRLRAQIASGVAV